MNILLLEWNEWFRKLQAYGAQLIDDEAAVKAARATPDTHIVFKRQMPDTLPAWIQEGIAHPIEWLQLFCILKDSCGMIHTDGIDRACGLNVPVRDTHMGLMEWYPEGFSPKQVAGGGTVSNVTQQEAAIYPKRWPYRGEGTLVVDQPALIRTNVWHRVDNTGNPQNRYTLSLRFKGNPSFDEVAKSFPQ